MKTARFVDITARFCEITRFGDYLEALKNLSRMTFAKDTAFLKGYRDMTVLVDEICETYMNANKIPHKEDIKESIGKLIWYLLTFPTLDSKPCNSSIRRLEKVLTYIIKGFYYELQKQYKMESNDIERDKLMNEHLDMFNSLLNIIESRQKSSEDAIESKVGLHSLYLEMTKENFFSPRLALAINVYFNHKAAVTIKSRTDSYSDYSKKGKTGNVDPDSRHLIKEWIKSFPLGYDIFPAPIAIMRQAFVDRRDSESKLEDITFENLWKVIRSNSQKYQPETINRKEAEFEIFKESAKHLKAIWVAQDDLFEVEEEYEDSTADEEFKEIETLIAYDDYGEDYYRDLSVKNKKLISTYSDVEKVAMIKRKYIDENIAYRIQSEGINRLAYTSDSWRYITNDVISMFVGYIRDISLDQNKQKELKLSLVKDDYEDIIYAFTESFLTSAHIKKIFDEYEGNETSRLAGMYISLRKKEMQIRIKVQRYWESFVKILKSFNKYCPEYSFNTRQIYYTGKTNLIEKGGFSPVEIMHISKSLMPTARSAIHYVQPKRIVERFMEYEKTMANELLELVNTGGLMGDLKAENRMIFNSKSNWTRILCNIEKTTALRKQQYESNKPEISIISDEQLARLYGRVQRFLNDAIDNDTSVKDMVVIAEKVLYYFLHLLLLVRHTETNRLDNKSFDLGKKMALIHSKQNKEFNTESRILPLSKSLSELVNIYVSIKEKYIEILKVKETMICSEKKKKKKRITKDTKKNNDNEYIICKETSLPGFIEMVRDIEWSLDLYSFRKKGATAIHNLLYCDSNSKESTERGIVLGIPMEKLNYILGHSFRGFESLSTNSQMHYDEVKRCFLDYQNNDIHRQQIEVSINDLRRLLCKMEIILEAEKMK